MEYFHVPVVPVLHITAPLTRNLNNCVHETLCIYFKPKAKKGKNFHKYHLHIVFVLNLTKFVGGQSIFSHKMKYFFMDSPLA